MVEGTVAGQTFDLISHENMSYVIYVIDCLIPPLHSPCPIGMWQL